MKPLHVTWLLSAAGGGIPPAVLALRSAQRACGDRPEVFGVRDRRGPSGPGDARLFEPIGPRALGFAPAMMAALGHSDPDVIHLHGLFTWPSRVSLRAGRRGKPVVIAPHGMLDPWALRRSAWKKRLFFWYAEGENLRRAACLHALSGAEARNLRALGLRNPIAVIPNGVCPPSSGEIPDRSGFGKRYPVAQERRLLLYLGRIHPKKGLINLIDAWAALRSEGSLRRERWLLVIAGPDQLGHASDLRARVAERGLAANVLFTGPLAGQAKAEALSAASAFVLPSYSEGFPVAVLEAMSYGLPVILTRQCNFDVAASGSGLVCEPNPASIADAVRELLAAAPSVREALGRRGADLVRAEYTWDLAAGKLAEVYRWLLGAPRPDCVEAAK